MKLTPLVNVVVYCEPGPHSDMLERHALEYVVRTSPWPPSGGLGYVVLVAADFDRLWRGVTDGDAVGTAAGVLRCLGPQLRDLIGRPQDYVYGWLGDEGTDQGRVLLLQVFPKSSVIQRTFERPRPRATLGFPLPMRMLSPSASAKWGN